MPDHVIEHGGACPRCFAEIPGEEAPTDPGEEVRATQERSDRRRATARAVFGLLTMLVVVSCTGTIALVVLLWPDPEIVQILDLDEPGLEYRPEDFIITPEPAPVAPDPAPAPAPKPGPASQPRPTPAPTTAPRPAPKPPPSLDDPFGVRTDIERDDNMVYDTPDGIRMMIGEDLVAQIPTLNQCYERQLKVEPDLSGRWRLDFVVARDGSVKNASATALSRASRDFEDCMTGVMNGRWSFGKVISDQPVRRTLTFRPG